MRKQYFGFFELLCLLAVIGIMVAVGFAARKEQYQIENKKIIINYEQENVIYKTQLINYYNLLISEDKESQTYKNVITEIQNLKVKISNNELAISKLKIQYHID